MFGYKLLSFENNQAYVDFHKKTVRYISWFRDFRGKNDSRTLGNIC